MGYYYYHSSIPYKPKVGKSGLGVGFQREVQGPRTFPLTGRENYIWEFPKIRRTFFLGPYNKDPTI